MLAAANSAAPDFREDPASGLHCLPAGAGLEACRIVVSGWYCAAARAQQSPPVCAPRRAYMRFFVTVMTTVRALAPITLYTNRMCPFAQRCAVALEYAGVDYDSVEVNLYGSGGFDKSKLRAVETAGGLSPAKGYIPVLTIGGETFRESDECVKRLAEAIPELRPEDAAAADAMIELCNGALAEEGRALVGSGRKRSARLDECLAAIRRQPGDPRGARSAPRLC